MFPPPSKKKKEKKTNTYPLEKKGVPLYLGSFKMPHILEHSPQYFTLNKKVLFGEDRLVLKLS